MEDISSASSAVMRRLKRGVALYATENPDCFIVGSKKRAIRIETIEEKSFLENLAVGASEGEIASLFEKLTPVQQKNCRELLIKLEQNQLCDLRQGKLALSKRFISSNQDRALKNSRPERDAAFIQLQNRVAAELTQTDWINRVDDGGFEILSSRQDFLVEISGTSRVATILYSLLLASGATQTCFASGSRGATPLVGDMDIAIGSFTTQDIGYNFDKQCEALRKELSLFPLDRDSNYLDEISTPELRVHCGDLDPEKLSLWMSSGQAFIHIPTPQGDSAQIGPLVIPGKSPCLRCAELVTREQSGVSDRKLLSTDPSADFPVIAAYFIASLAASQILAFFEGRSSEITGKVISLDYQALSHPQVATIARHPLCGCAF
jgi:hypothetical protein